MFLVLFFSYRLNVDGIKVIISRIFGWHISPRFWVRIFDPGLVNRKKKKNDLSFCGTLRKTLESGLFYLVESKGEKKVIMEVRGMECEDWIWYKEVKKRGRGEWCVQRQGLAVHLVCGGKPHSAKRVAYKAGGVYCQLSISHQHSGLNLSELPETAQGSADA